MRRAGTGIAVVVLVLSGCGGGGGGTRADDSDAMTTPSGTATDAPMMTNSDECVNAAQSWLATVDALRNAANPTPDMVSVINDEGEKQFEVVSDECSAGVMLAMGRANVQFQNLAAAMTGCTFDELICERQVDKAFTKGWKQAQRVRSLVDQ